MGADCRHTIHGLLPRNGADLFRVTSDNALSQQAKSKPNKTSTPPPQPSFNS